MTAARTLQAEDGADVLTKVLPRTPESVPVARDIARKALKDWGLTMLVDDVALVVSELAGNAAQHARANVMRLTIRRIAHGVRVAVIDKSHRQPVLKTPGRDTVDGRGLALVAAVSYAWGVEPLPWGKRVWADLAVPSAT